MENVKGCMNCGNISCGNNKKRESAGCGRWISSEDRIKFLEDFIHDTREQVKNDNDTYEKTIAKSKELLKKFLVIKNWCDQDFIEQLSYREQIISEAEEFLKKEDD